MPEEVKLISKHLLDVDFDQLYDEFQINKETGEGLLKYLFEISRQDERDNFARTYVVLDSESSEIVGFFSLRVGSIPMDSDSPKERMPGIEVMNLAVSDVYKERHETSVKLGKYIFATQIIPIIKEVSSMVGIKIVYIYSLPIPELQEYYRSFGFEALDDKDAKVVYDQVKPAYDDDCIFMYMSL